jgi:hypothetical protein
MDSIGPPAWAAGTKDNVIALTGPRPHLAEYGAVLGAA